MLIQIQVRVRDARIVWRSRLIGLQHATDNFVVIIIQVGHFGLCLRDDIQRASVDAAAASRLAAARRNGKLRPGVGALKWKQQMAMSHCRGLSTICSPILIYRAASALVEASFDLFSTKNNLIISYGCAPHTSFDHVAVVASKNHVWCPDKGLSPEGKIPPRASLLYKGTQLYMQEQEEPVPQLDLQQTRARSTVPLLATKSEERTHKWPVKSLHCDHFTGQPWISVRETIQPKAGWKFNPETKRFMMAEVTRFQAHATLTLTHCVPSMLQDRGESSAPLKFKQGADTPPNQPPPSVASTYRGIKRPAPKLLYPRGVEVPPPLPVAPLPEGSCSPHTTRLFL